jgi:hypothetical protein
MDAFRMATAIWHFIVVTARAERNRYRLAIAQIGAVDAIFSGRTSLPSGGNTQARTSNQHVARQPNPQILSGI